MTDEQEQEIKVTGGIGAFFYASIFWVLGLGALTWIGVASGIVEFHHHLTVAERMDNRVGVRELLVNPVKVIIPAKQSCFAVNRTFADGDTITFYIHNGCHRELDYTVWGWRAKAPDGTVIAQKRDNTLEPTEPDANLEKVMQLPDDDRIVIIEVWSRDQP
jgi:hypothetical protein